MQKVKIHNMKSNSSGQPVANQFEIQTHEGIYFQSYQTVIAFKPVDGPIQLDCDRWDYSTTTGKYRNQFLGEKKADTERKIKSGEYVLADLN